MSNIEQLLEKYAEELKQVGLSNVPPLWFMPEKPVYNTPIKARDNYLKAVKGKKPVFLPYEMDEAPFSPTIFPDAIARALVLDKHVPDQKGGKDMFGIDWEFIEAVGGSMVRPGVPAVTDITTWEDVITFPDIDAWDWEGSQKDNADYFESKDYAMNIWIMNGLFERLISFMDFEDAAVALIDDDEKEAVHRLFDKLASMYEHMLELIGKHYDVDVVYFHDDWGSQRAPFFSADVCREMIAPYLKRVVDATHKNGMLFNFHCCGKNEELVPVMIECGVDIWGGQPMNDFEMLYDKYGNDITLVITFDGPGPEASLEEVAEACQNFIERYSGNGNIIWAEPRKELHPQLSNVLYVLSREFYK